MQRAKGAGVDCGMLLLEVYHRAGVIPYYEPEPYPHDWHLHRERERFLEIVEMFCSPVDVPQPADVVVFKYYRAYAHGGIIVRWPQRIIHSFLENSIVVISDASKGRLAAEKDGSPRPLKFYRPFAWLEE